MSKAKTDRSATVVTVYVTGDLLALMDATGEPRSQLCHRALTHLAAGHRPDENPPAPSGRVSVRIDAESLAAAKRTAQKAGWPTLNAAVVAMLRSGVAEKGKS